MGMVYVPGPYDDWTDVDLEGDCPDCDGTGIVDADAPGVHDLEKTCEKCGGSGYLDPPEPDDD